MTGQGKAACAQFCAGWFGALPDAHVQVHDFHIAGDAAVEEGTFTGTHQGVLHSPAGDIPPTGRPITLDYIHVLRYRDGLHVSFNLIYDRLQMLEQPGLIPGTRTHKLSHSPQPGGSIWPPAGSPAAVSARGGAPNLGGPR